jgi:hypothetical protein
MQPCQRTVIGVRNVTHVAPATFDLAANAANNDETAEGDYIHTAVVETSPARPLNR